MVVSYLNGKYQERPGEAIKRLMPQLEGINQAIYLELGEGIQDPEGARGGCPRNETT